PTTTSVPSVPSTTLAPSAPSGSTTTAAAVVSGPVRRPNGQLYHPRQLSGLPDVTALRRLRQAGGAALLYGPPGTGKTSVVEAAFPDLVTVQGDGDTTVADLVGEYTQTPDGRYVFVFSELDHDLGFGCRCGAGAAVTVRPATSPNAGRLRLMV